MRADLGPHHLQSEMFNFIQSMATTPGAPTLTRFQTIGNILGVALNVIMGAGFAIALASIGYSAIQYALSSGDPKAATQAWHTFIWGVIAAAFAVGALGIKAAVLATLGPVSPDISNALPSF